MSTARARPIEKFARAVAQCSSQGAAYGKCIAADFNNVKKDKCIDDFLKLKECYMAALKKK
ncbi:hypothetical protein EV356DRAFT_510275 [Viridothelium virens]|uniref:IMS import disulfide relay-system CHCH-CHCH-like Cx9C domain-containing protein n=1 Tax=Viridothelium virens TaxID=1048519 RepID=A0A6A6GVG0_VIRVR|nr:hypothetical protein EV356DRAFT_510275 [Viridothelium virens]